MQIKIIPTLNLLQYVRKTPLKYVISMLKSVIQVWRVIVSVVLCMSSFCKSWANLQTSNFLCIRNLYNTNTLIKVLGLRNMLQLWWKSHLNSVRVLQVTLNPLNALCYMLCKNLIPTMVRTSDLKNLLNALCYWLCSMTCCALDCWQWAFWMIVKPSNSSLCIVGIC